MINKIFKKTVALIVILVMSVSVFASTEDTSASNWAKESFDKAIDLGIVSDVLYQKAQSNIKRKEICNMAIDFFRVFTGKSGVTLLDSPFYDDTSNDVSFAFESGIMNGVTKTFFAPDGNVTREQLASVVVNTLKACGVELDMEVKSRTIFTDAEDIDSDLLDAVNLLVYEKVVSGYDGYYYPKTYVTVEQAVSVFIRAYEAFKTYDLTIGDNNIKFGEEKESIVSKLGEPDRSVTNEYGFERYIYNKDLENFVIVGFKDDKVEEMFSNALNMKYKDITHETNISDIHDIGIIYNESSEKVNIRSHETMTTVYFDSNQDLNVDSVYIRGINLAANSDSFTVEFAENIELELFDIINAARVRRGMEPFVWSEAAAESAKKHSTNMRTNKSVEYNDDEGLSPFERMENEKIEFIIAAENISWVLGDSISIYTTWASNVGTKTNLFNSSLTHAGIGAVTNGNSACTTIDMYKPLNPVVLK